MTRVIINGVDMTFDPGPGTMSTTAPQAVYHEDPDEPLPEFDEIPSIRREPGIYDLRREGLSVKSRLAFLKKVADKWGEDADVVFLGGSDGYPGFIKVMPTVQKELSL